MRKPEPKAGAHRLTGQSITVSGKPWSVYDQDGPNRLWVGRVGETDRQSWPIDVVEGYVLDQAAKRKDGAA